MSDWWSWINSPMKARLLQGSPWAELTCQGRQPDRRPLLGLYLERTGMWLSLGLGLWGRAPLVPSPRLTSAVPGGDLNVDSEARFPLRLSG